MKRHLRFASALGSGMLGACALVIAGCSRAPVSYEAGIDTAGMDTTVKPGDDFFAYAIGAWDKATEIPADRSTWGGNAILGEKVSKDVAALIEGAAASKPKAGSEAGLRIRVNAHER